MGRNIQITQGRYIIDKNSILEKAYDLLCVLFANKEIARRSTPVGNGLSLTDLEHKFFESKTSRLLIEIAVALRVLDDQMKNLPPGNIEKQKYYDIKNIVDSYDLILFDDDPKHDLRKTCNRIIHSEVLEPHFSEGQEGHELDYNHRYGDEERSIKWEHFNGYVRLAGKEFKKEWHVLLDIEVFILSVFKLLSW